MITQLISTLLGLFTGIYLVLVGYLRIGWSALPAYFPKARPRSRVSVLIAARNEEKNIRRTLDDILAQDYPEGAVEVIVVDDHSTDQTAEIVRTYADRGVKLLRLQEDQPLNSYKKKAIATAVAEATGTWVVTTDADCRMGPDWLATILSFAESTNSVLVSSPVIYSEQHSFFETLQTLEFLYLIGLGAAGIGNKYPSTCNGANLAYRRDVFYEMGGFSGIDHLASGDDELFLHKVASRYPDRIGFCKSREAIVYTDAKKTLKGFIQQRRRWASKSTHYRKKGLVALGAAIWMFNFLLMISAGAALVTGSGLWLAVVGALLIKMTIELVFLYPVCKFAGRRDLLIYLPLLTIVHVIYMVYIGIAGNSGKYQWKGRSVS